MQRFHTWVGTLAIPLLFVLLSAAPPTAAQDEVRAGVCRTVQASDAIARGSAIPLYVRDSLTSTDLRFSDARSEQAGVGSKTDSETALNLQHPADGSIARVTLLQATTNTRVEPNGDTWATKSTSMSQVASVDLLNGFIRAKLVRAEADALATDSMADLTGNGSVIDEVIIDGVLVNDVAPNTRVPLPDDLFGANSYVKLYERKDIGLFPSHTRPFYRANLTVKMIHVKVTDHNPILNGEQSLEIVVGEAWAYAQAPTPFCGGAQSVGASAYVARARVEPYFWSPSALHGYVKVPPTGGYSEQNLTDVNTPFGDKLLIIESATTRSQGKVLLGEASKASAYEKLAGVCIRSTDSNGEGDCLVKADVIKVESYARADPDQAIAWGHMTLLNLTVAGINVCDALGLGDTTCKPPKNTRLQVGEFKIILNERVREFDGPGFMGYTVRGVRIEHPEMGQVILGRAHAEATYR